MNIKQIIMSETSLIYMCDALNKIMKELEKDKKPD